MVPPMPTPTTTGGQGVFANVVSLVCFVVANFKESAPAGLAVCPWFTATGKLAQARSTGRIVIIGVPVFDHVVVTVRRLLRC